jgi:nitronate monooxygenase
MLNIATAPLATSVSLAGGIGFIAGGYDTTLSNLETNLHHASQLIQSHPDQSNPACKFYTQTGVLPLGVGFINWGVDRNEALRILRRYRVAAVWLFAPRDGMGDLLVWVDRVRGLYQEEQMEDVDDSKSKSKETTAPQIWIQISSIAETTTALKHLHPDVLVIQGSDAGGHGLARSASLITLLPEVSNLIAEHYTPSTKTVLNEHQPPTLLAAGGLTNGLTLSATLLLGATGGVMGTRFLASHEAHITPGYQNAILRAVDGGVSTVRTTVYDRVRDIKGWPERYDGRGIVNATYLDAVGGMSDEENRRLYVNEMKRGDEGWAWDVDGRGRMTTYAGTGVGLIKEVLGVGEIVRQVWGEVADVKRRVRARL